ncbi:SDR family NAD(P)-dependent oxidoreductase [Vulcanisaeta distributa]|uniref:Short-chain dehydrogenase/reductase SDR n=1 Tax=Vulcanisaeta distributa (strain DSM 14429 / JCM 11212 / NBRC 100878 / IC-017) TaxID=572478 RepID=E1QNK5_VULDI|nr:glucose 1-dehydrogenase [Vulcanisaeta distributa]ADN51293.1 short-chain dehydrogenase/reductase SDR [Vulcanisaeta distributa DSM 14429]
MGRLKDKVILVTGASRGIGRAIARAVAGEGARVIINYRSSAKEAEELMLELRRSGFDASVIKADVSREDEVKSMFKLIERDYGVLHGVVNNAGHGSATIWNKRLRELTWSDFEEVITVDLKGTFLCSKFGIELMRDGGSIVNVASITARTGDTTGIPYLVAKSGIIALTKSMALSLAPRIRVNAVVLGSIETGWVNWLSNDEVRKLINYIPMGRLGKPEEVARAVVFLLSDDSSFITGHTIVIDGGECTACD